MDETTTQESTRDGEATRHEEATTRPDGSDETTGRSDGETAVGLPVVPLEGDPPLGGESSLDGDEAAAALRGHADGVAATVDRLVETLEDGGGDPSELAAARTETSELLALLRAVRVETDGGRV